MKTSTIINFRNLVLVIIVLFPAFANAQNTTYSDYNNLYLNKSSYRDNRVHDQSNIGIVIMAPINIDLPKVIDEDVYPDDPADYNRLPESGFPGLRFFKGNRTKTFSFLYARKAYKFDGSGNSDIGSNYKSYLEKGSKSRMALRFAYDWHFKPNRFKRFDMDHYMGYSANLGLAPASNTLETVTLNDVSNSRVVKSSPITMGGDVYWGANLKFEYFSIGAEFLIFGMDYQRNVGRDKIAESTSNGGVTTSNTYYQTDYLNNEVFSDLNASSSQMTMFKGFRLSAIVYLKNPRSNN